MKFNKMMVDQYMWVTNTPHILVSNVFYRNKKGERGCSLIVCLACSKAWHPDATLDGDAIFCLSDGQEYDWMKLSIDKCTGLNK